MRLFICASLLLVGCSAGSGDVESKPLIVEVGNLENKKLDEVSGLARSNRVEDVFWAINDDGPAAVHALNTNGKNLGEVEIANAENRDWEDIASFVLDDTAYLVIADIGDNGSKHEYLSLYVVEEPDLRGDDAELAWQINFRYPNGPRDAESLAVDSAGQFIYVLSKRDVPAQLFQLPLRPESDDVLTARQVAVVDTLRQPSLQEQQYAAENASGVSDDWPWQATAMDIAADGSSVLILTYSGVNYFSRSAGQSIADALGGRAMHLAIGMYKEAESIAYTSDSSAAIVTVEKKHAPILRIELVL